MTLSASTVALIGISGAGKSAVAPLLAARLGGRAEDLDRRIEAEQGRTIVELFAREGEAAFRRLEVRALAASLDAGVAVLACGGGVVVTPEGRDLLRRRTRPAWLEVAPEEAARRLGGGGERPLLGGREPGPRLAELLAQRAGWYAEVAVARVATDGRLPAEVAEAVARALEAPSETRT